LYHVLRHWLADIRMARPNILAERTCTSCVADTITPCAPREEHRHQNVLHDSLQKAQLRAIATA
jgi:hypothetical protein